MADAFTNLAILSPALLYGEAWRALLSGQPGISINRRDQRIYRRLRSGRSTNLIGSNYRG